MQESVHCVKLRKTAGQIHRVDGIDVIAPKKPTKRKILNSQKVKRNQKWERYELPEGFDWNASDDEYREQDIRFIEEDFERRLNGTWVMINGVSLLLFTMV